MPLQFFFCRVPEFDLHMAAGGLCRWPDPDISWSILSTPPRISEEEVGHGVMWGLAAWQRVCGIKPRFTATARLARIWVEAKSLDGPGKVLAMCELPCGGQSSVRLTLDINEEWLTSLDSRDRGIYLALVLCHELGHGLGLGHAPEQSNNIMAPVYNPRITVAGDWETRELLRRYPAAAPTPVPVPTPVPTPPSGGTMTKDELKAMINEFLATVDGWISMAETVANWTFFTKVDDNAVAKVKFIAEKLRPIAQNDFLLDLLLMVFKLKPNATLVDALPIMDELKVLHMVR